MDDPLKGPNPTGWPWMWPLSAGLAFGEAFRSSLLSRNPGDPPRPEQVWATPHTLALDLGATCLRAFSDTKGPVNLVVGPYALHGASIADFAPNISLMEVLKSSGVPNLHLFECKSAGAAQRLLGIDDYLSALNVAVDFLGGRVSLTGLCQGGWLSLMYAARFPHKVRRLALIGSPVDLDAGASPIVDSVRTMPPEVLRALVMSEDGLVIGQKMQQFWAQTFDALAIADILQVDEVPPDVLARFAEWDAYTLDLPGVYFCEVLENLFRRNELARGAFVALGQMISLRDVKVPLYLLAGEDDRVTPPEQLLSVAKLVGTRKGLITRVTTPCDHLSLFLGARTLANEWRNIGAWLAGR